MDSIQNNSDCMCSCLNTNGKCYSPLTRILTYRIPSSVWNSMLEFIHSILKLNNNFLLWFETISLILNWYSTPNSMEKLSLHVNWTTFLAISTIYRKHIEFYLWKLNIFHIGMRMYSLLELEIESYSEERPTGYLSLKYFVYYTIKIEH